MHVRMASWLLVASCAGVSIAQPFTQVISFGDSLTDTGNVSNATFGLSPGGNYFSGRYSNGPTWVETMAGSLGLAAPSPSRTGGRNYAHAGTKTGPGNTTFVFFSFPNAGTQVNQFLSGNTPAPSQLFTVWAGANDFLGNLSQNPTTIVNNLVAHVTALSNAGAGRIVVPNLPPLGLTPRYNTDPVARDAYNNLTASFNAQLDAAMVALDAQLPARLYRFDVAGEFARILASPGDYGLTNVNQPALVGGSVVPDPDQYLFYDDVHPTRVGHRLLGLAAFDLVTTHNWVGGIGNFAVPTNWDPAGVPAVDWICTIGNTAGPLVLAEVTDLRRVRQVLVSGSAGPGAIDVAGSGSLEVTEFIRLDSGGVLQAGIAGSRVKTPLIDVRSGGRIGGGRDLLADVVNAGTVAPDAGLGPVGPMTVTGNYTQNSTGVLEIDLTGIDGLSDRLVVTGNAALDGILRLRTDGTIPLPGYSFQIASFNSASENLTIVNATGRAGLRFTKVLTPTSLGVNLSGFPGDANLDAIVNIADFATLAANFNQTGQNWLGGDFTFDGSVTIADFALLAGNFNQSAPAARSVVPEPTGAIMLLSGLAGLRTRRRRPAGGG